MKRNETPKVGRSSGPRAAAAADADCREILTLPNSVSYGNGSPENTCACRSPATPLSPRDVSARAILCPSRAPVSGIFPRHARVFSYVRTIPSDPVIVSTGKRLRCEREITFLLFSISSIVRPAYEFSRATYYENRKT